MFQNDYIHISSKQVIYVMITYSTTLHWGPVSAQQIPPSGKKKTLKNVFHSLWTLLGDRKSLPIAKNHPKSSQEVREQIGPFSSQNEEF